jgi:hypothetical protein
LNSTTGKIQAGDCSNAWQQGAKIIKALLVFPAETAYDFHKRAHVKLAKLLQDSCSSIKRYSHSNITLEFRTGHYQ